jgi:hypothetical protein
VPPACGGDAPDQFRPRLITLAAISFGDATATSFAERSQHASDEPESPDDACCVRFRHAPPIATDQNMTEICIRWQRIPSLAPLCALCAPASLSSLRPLDILHSGGGGSASHRGNAIHKASRAAATRPCQSHAATHLGGR